MSSSRPSPSTEFDLDMADCDEFCRKREVAETPPAVRLDIQEILSLPERVPVQLLDDAILLLESWMKSSSCRSSLPSPAAMNAIGILKVKAKRFSRNASRVS